jgi:MSHA biogenesis protein MshQ
VVRPFAFSIESGDPNFNAADASGSAFRKAGENFGVDLRAVLWESGDDIDNDGIPDVAADLTDNTVTPNFGQETTAATVDMSHTLVLPSTPGDPGTLSGGAGIGGFGSGVTTATLSFDEVGIVDLTADLVDFLGDPNADATGTVSDVGRFYPDRFVVADNGPSFIDECTAGASPFTYQDQTFRYGVAPILTVTAVNENGGITENYGGGSAGPEGFWKLTSTLPRSYTNQAGAAAIFADLQDPDVTLAGDSDFDGAGSFSLDSGMVGDAFMYSRVSEEDEFNANVDLSFAAGGLTDIDGVCYDLDNNDVCDSYNNITAMSGATLRFGRLVIGMAFGSELLPLAVPLQTEYFSTSAFVLNTDDDCTTLAVTNLSLTSAVEVNEMDGTIDVSDGAFCAGSGISTASLISPFSAGDGTLSFTAPGNACTGIVDIDVDLSSVPMPPHPDMNWLRYDWDGDGNFDNDPSGQATFGIYRGPEDIIYTREPWP